MLTLNVAICDDSTTIQAIVKEILQAHLTHSRVNVCFIMFSDGEELLDSTLPFDIIILDIEMEHIGGIAVKDKLYLLGNDAKIIFLSGHEEGIHNAFGKNVYGYINKKNIGEITKYMDIIVHEFKRTRMIDLSGYLIDMWQVKYIQASRVYSTLYTSETDTKIVRKSLKEMDLLLIKNDLFIRVHRSYIVNLRFVREISNTQVFLEDNTTIPISSTYLHALQECISAHK